MGLFGIFKSAEKNEPSIVKNADVRSDVSNSMPTVKPDKKLFECYDEVFGGMIQGISGVSRIEAAEIHSIIKTCEGGFLNMSGYHSVVWEKFFKGRDWQWEEYEDWNEIFTNLKKFPSRFLIRNPSSSTSIEDVLAQLKVSELKNLLEKNQLTFPPKAKKNELIEVVKAIPNIADSELVSSKNNEINERFDYSLYSLFMRTINFRAKSLHDRRRAEALGIKKYEILHTFEEDREFVEMALKLNPQALHPVFPGDMSTTRIVLPF